MALEALALNASVTASPQDITMPSPVPQTHSTVIPVLRFRDAPAAIEWLCKAFGFEKHLVVPGPEGTVRHAQLRFGGGMVMLGSALDNETAFGRLMTQPDQTGGANTQSTYVVVGDADAVYAKAKQAGAKMAMEIRDEDYGGRAFSCHDLEGNLWSFGTYDPW